MGTPNRGSVERQEICRAITWHCVCLFFTLYLWTVMLPGSDTPGFPLWMAAACGKAEGNLVQLLLVVNTV